MSTPILATKFYIPTLRADLMPRPRLIDKLTAGVAKPLVLISAPAGFGKTTIFFSSSKRRAAPMWWRVPANWVYYKLPASRPLV